MGMVEPLLNLDEIKKAINILTHPKGIALSKKRITLSTSGIIKGIYTLADYENAPRLAVSLTTADATLRNSLMPVEKSNPLPQLKQAIKYFNERTKKRVTIRKSKAGNISGACGQLGKIKNNE